MTPPLPPSTSLGSTTQATIDLLRVGFHRNGHPYGYTVPGLKGLPAPEPPDNPDDVTLWLMPEPGDEGPAARGWTVLTSTAIIEETPGAGPYPPQAQLIGLDIRIINLPDTMTRWLSRELAEHPGDPVDITCYSAPVPGLGRGQMLVPRGVNAHVLTTTSGRADLLVRALRHPKGVGSDYFMRVTMLNDDDVPVDAQPPV